MRVLAAELGEPGTTGAAALAEEVSQVGGTCVGTFGGAAGRRPLHRGGAAREGCTVIDEGGYVARGTP